MKPELQQQIKGIVLTAGDSDYDKIIGTVILLLANGLMLPMMRRISAGQEIFGMRSDHLQKVFM